MQLHLSLAGAVIRILATLTMDMGALLGVRLGIPGPGPRRLGPDLIGRWIGYLGRGKFKHDNILRTPPLRGESVCSVITRSARCWAWLTSLCSRLCTSHPRFSRPSFT